LKLTGRQKILAGLFIVLFLLVVVACKLEKGPSANASSTQVKSSVSDNKEGPNMVFQPVVAGRFYPGSKDALAKEVDDYIEKADMKPISGEVFGVISPHAGYIFSAPVAGYSFKSVKGKKYDAVVVLGVSHQIPGDVGILKYKFYRTPLGEVKIDSDLVEKISQAAPWISTTSELFDHEHSMEVQLPFIQRALPDTPVVMICIGSFNGRRAKDLAEILDKTLANKKILVVASSDMSHYHGYDQARQMDLEGLKLVEAGNIEVLAKAVVSRQVEFCGIMPILTLMELHKLRGGKKIQVLKYLNSGDTAGDKSRVVGYGSVAFLDAENPKVNVNPENAKEIGVTSKTDEISDDDKKTMLKIARATLESYIREGKTPQFNITSEYLKKPGAAFVTLEVHHQLRGCIGHVIAQEPLWMCIRDMAIAASSQDPRFPKVTPDEVANVDIEVSVLTPPVKVNDINEIEVGKHGLIISRSFYRGLLLPQVATEYGWDRMTFLEQTCRKAGLPPDAWKKGATIEKFSAIVFNEGQLGRQK